MMLVLVSSFSFAQFRSKQDVYNYLEGKTFVYLDHFRASFHNAVINLEWEDVYKCKMNVYSFSANEARLSGSFKVNSLYGVITYPMEMTLDRINEEFKLTGSPEDGTYKLAPQTDTPRTNSFDNSVYEIQHVDIVAQFPNGQMAMFEWLSHHIQYPSLTADKGESGRVVVSFIVDKDGSITDPKIKKGVSQSLDAEALRVIKNMPKWIPARKDGKTVKMKMDLPITFGLK